MRYAAAVSLLLAVAGISFSQDAPPVTMPQPQPSQQAPINWTELIMFIGGLITYITNAVIKYLQEHQKITEMKASTEASRQLHSMFSGTMSNLAFHAAQNGYRFPPANQAGQPPQVG